MKFNIPCETFTRLAQIPSFFTPSVDEETRQQLRCVRIENVKGHRIAIVANQKIAAIEYLGPTTDQDGVAHVMLDPMLLDVCKKESKFNSWLEINLIPEIATGIAQTMLGYTHKGNACMFPVNSVMNGWREWGPLKPVTKTTGPLFLNLDYIELLNKTSPSGKIVFAEHIDVSQPTVIRDRENECWVGLFFPAPPLTEPGAIAAILPNWWRL